MQNSRKHLAMRFNGQRSHAFMIGLIHAQGSTAKPTTMKPSVEWPNVSNSIRCKIVIDRVLCCGTFRRKSGAPQFRIHCPHGSSQADSGGRGPTLQLALCPHHHILLFPSCASQNWDAYDCRNSRQSFSRTSPSRRLIIIGAHKITTMQPN